MMRKRWILIAALAFVIAAPLNSTFATQTTITFSQNTVASASTVTYPPGNRVVRIRPLDPNSTWILPGYTATDVLKWITDLKPTTLNRYTTGTQFPNASVPVASGQPPMSIQQFLQQSLNDMGPNPVIFPRISFKDYATSPTLFMSEAQSLYTLYSKLSPSQTLLSLDNTNTYFATHTVADAQILESQLLAIGWTGIAWGACAATNQLPTGTTFAMICITPPTWQPDYSTMAALQAQQPSIKEYETQIDFPGVMSSFAALSPDQEAAVITNLASNQSSHGYHYMYPIMQLKSGSTSNTFAWDSTKVVTSASGPYHGETLYTVMKNLMQLYNPIGPVTPDFSIQASPSTLAFTTSTVGSTSVTVSAIGSFTESVRMTVPASNPQGLSTSCPTAITLGTSFTCTFTSSSNGSYTQVLSATNGTLTHSVSLSITVGPLTSPDFSIQTSTSTMSLIATSNSPVPVTISPLNGFAATISLTVITNSTALSCSLSHSRLTGGSGSSSLSCSSTIAANYLATVTATSGPMSHSVGIVFEVQDFGVSFNLASVTVSQGSSKSVTIIISSLNGFSGDVMLTGTVSPSGPTVTINPSSVTGSGGSVVMTLTVPSGGGSSRSVSNGTYSVNVTATSGPVSHSRAFQVSVASTTSPLGLANLPLIYLVVGGAIVGIILASTTAILLRRRKTG